LAAAGGTKDEVVPGCVRERNRQESARAASVRPVFKQNKSQTKKNQETSVAGSTRPPAARNQT